MKESKERSKKYRVYMGYDPREDLAYKVAEYSILSRTDKDEVEVIPINLATLPLSIFNRPIEKRINENGVEQLWCPISGAPMSTEFAISRFAVPFLAEEGQAVFMDSDIICLTDIREIFLLGEERCAVSVVKHKHEPTEKFHDAGRLQTFYKRKNWSSVVLWNLDHKANKRFHIEHLNKFPGRHLHAFMWLTDFEIGELPQEWNYLVGVNEPADLRKQKMVHYTNGQPGWHEGWVAQDTDYLFNEEWTKYKEWAQA